MSDPQLSEAPMILDTPHGQQAVEAAAAAMPKCKACVGNPCFPSCYCRERTVKVLGTALPHLLAGIAEAVREHLRDQDATLSHRKARGVISTSVWEEGAKYAADYILSLRGR